MKIRTTIAVMAAKITGHVCKLMGRQGVTWAGKIALKICPDILEELSSQVREKIFVVVEPTERQQPITCSVQDWRQKVKKLSVIIPVPIC